MKRSQHPDSLRVLVLSTCENQLSTLSAWLDHYRDGPALHPGFVHIDREQRWQQHAWLQNPDELAAWQAAIVLVDELCDTRKEWLQALQARLPTVLISNADHYLQLPQVFQQLAIADINRDQFFRSLKPLQLFLRPDIAPPMNRNDFFADLHQRLLNNDCTLYLQIIQCRWLYNRDDDNRWQQQQSVQQEFERAIQLRSPANTSIGRILDDQLIIVSDDYYDLQADWLPKHPDNDLRPWVVYYSVPMHLSEFSGLSAVLQEGVQQIARERLVQEAQIDWRQHEQQDPQSLSLFDGLHLALQRNEFYLKYQPQFDSRSGDWVGVEALMRWRHPTLGVIPPTVFIREAETAGLIQALGQWVMRETITTWQRIKDLTGKSIRMAVNVSFPEIADPGYADQVLERLNQSGMPPRFLELELTETAMMRDASVSLLNLRRLKAAGLHVVLDDFGTGFSSLSHLNDLPLTGIKLDRAFISPLPDNGPQSHIVASMIELAQRLNLETTAEGVEDIACLELICGLGCDRIQGYVYAQPLALDDLIAQAREGFAPPRDFTQRSLF